LPLAPSQQLYPSPPLTPPDNIFHAIKPVPNSRVTKPRAPAAAAAKPKGIAKPKPKPKAKAKAETIAWAEPETVTSTKFKKPEHSAFNNRRLHDREMLRSKERYAEPWNGDSVSMEQVRLAKEGKTKVWVGGTWVIRDIVE